MSRAPLQRALDALRSAHVLAAAGLGQDAVSRAYYAAFHAARVALAAHGSTPRTHSGVASEFGRLIVLPGSISPDIARTLKRLATARDLADYSEDEVPSPEEIAQFVDEAVRFVDAVDTLLARPLVVVDARFDMLTDDQKRDLVAQLTLEMEEASENLKFEKAAELRDAIAQIEADLAA